jgi:hypothetical protein
MVPQLTTLPRAPKNRGYTYKMKIISFLNQIAANGRTFSFRCSALQHNAHNSKLVFPLGFITRLVQLLLSADATLCSVRCPAVIQNGSYLGTRTTESSPLCSCNEPLPLPRSSTPAGQDKGSSSPINFRIKCFTLNRIQILQNLNLNK